MYKSILFFCILLLLCCTNPKIVTFTKAELGKEVTIGASGWAITPPTGLANFDLDDTTSTTMGTTDNSPGEIAIYLGAAYSGILSLRLGVQGTGSAYYFYADEHLCHVVTVTSTNELLCTPSFYFTGSTIRIVCVNGSLRAYSFRIRTGK